MSDEDQKDRIEFDRMPGSDAPEEPAAESLDLNFGLGEEPVEEPEDVEEVVAEAEEAPVEDVEEAEEPVAVAEEPAGEDDSPSIGDQTPVTEAEEPVAEEPKRHMVPKSRLDEVLAKQKALEKQLDDLRAQKQEPGEAPEAYDFDAKEVEYQNLVLDGEAQKAAALEKRSEPPKERNLSTKLGQKLANPCLKASKPPLCSRLHRN